MNDKMREAVKELRDSIQEMRNNGENDLRTVLHFVDSILSTPDTDLVPKYLIEEAKIIADAHPSKDARAFARSVIDYFKEIGGQNE